MEEQVLVLLRDTLKSDTAAIRNAEQALVASNSNPQFPFALLAIAKQDSVELPIRKSALTTIKNYVSATWSPQLDETFLGQVYISDDAKYHIRNQVLEVASQPTSSASAELQPLAASVVARIASVDFPEAWPDLFPTLVNILNTSTQDPTVKGALKVILELIDSSLTEDQFFAAARDLVNAFRHIATGNQCGLNVRAYALYVFQSSFDMLEMVMGDHGPAVKAFLDESLKDWMTFFTGVLQEPLPPAPIDDPDKDDPRRGLVTFKVQVVKTIDKLRKVYAAGLSPYVLNLFQIVWQDLARIVAEYNALFIDGDEDGKLADEGDGLPYSLDALVVEEIDFLQVILKAPSVKAELNQQLQQSGTAENGYGWVQELLHLLAQYSRASKEENAMWDIDVDLYLSDMNSITTNYTPRAACAEVVALTLLGWLKQLLIDSMLFFASKRAQAGATGWKDHEAYLFLLNQALKEAEDQAITLDASLSSRLMEQVSSLLQNSSPYVRAGAQFALASFFKIAGEQFHPLAVNALTNLLQTVSNDDSDIVKVACFSAFAYYFDILPTSAVLPMQGAIFNAVAEFIASHDLKEELDEADEVKGTLVTTMHEAIMLEPSTVMDTSALDTYLTLASESSSSPLLSNQLIDSFESIAAVVAAQGQEQYAKLCAKTVPSLTAAFDIGDLTSEDALTSLAAELLSLLAEHGSDPLPSSFVVGALPKLQRVLMSSTVDTLVRPSTTAVQYLLMKGTQDFVQWKDQAGTPSLEVVLTIINRLLNAPEVDEHAAQEVGALASTVVDKYGADKLGPYLMELLRAVATRLASAEKVGFIQSLCMVFVTLATAAPKDVIDFLDQLTISGTNGLSVVLTKWLDNSILFAGFDEVRQNIVALSKLFSLQDPRIKQIGVKGDLVVENTGRIKTRSQAKLNPDRYTTIPADLKILKILTGELDSAATQKVSGIAGAQVADVADESEEEISDDEWNDVQNTGPIDLGSEKVREELMAMGGDGQSPTSARGGDDEMAEYLRGWVREEAQKEGFMRVFDQLNGEEQGVLKRSVV